jgi:thiol:disulfide interchange protein
MYGRWLRLLLAGLLLVGWLSVPLPVQAAPRYVQAELVSDVRAVQPGTPFWVGLQLRIAPGWHVYWQNPGDSGDRVRIRWQLPPGATAGEIQWPYPQRLPVGPLMNFGYRNQVLLLSQITPPAALTPGQTLNLQAQASWLVCREDCIPEATTLNLSLPVAAMAQANSAVTAALAQVRQQHPQPAPWPVVYQVTGEQLTFTWPSSGVKEAVFFPLADGVITYAAAQTVTHQGNTTQLRLVRGYQEDLGTIEGVLVVTTQQGTQAYSIQAVPGVLPTAGGGTLGRIVGLGFLGGLLLNAMPCVLPILSLKTLQLVDKVRQSPRQVRLGGLVYGVGVLVSFWAVAAALLFLRGLGQQLGWGFQLQSPGMVLLLMDVLLAVALNLSGVFQVGTGWLGAGHTLTEQPGYVGEFFTGVLATVAATPCTAPFMATAIGAALTLPPGEALAVFTSLGLGFACPYTLLCFVPRWRRWLPRPGAWMHTLQQLLAFPVYGAAAWLLWVLTLQTGTDGLAIGLISLLLVGLAAWLYGHGMPLGWRRFSLGSALLIVGLCLTLPGWLPVATPTEQLSAQSTANSVWESFSPERLQVLRRQGQPVFLNVTAAWCVSCQLNERLVFNRPEVQQAFRERGITLMKADWTRYDPRVTQVLQGFGRSGVPLYVLYPGGNQPPALWPSRLSPTQVMQLLSSQPGG